MSFDGNNGEKTNDGEEVEMKRLISIMAVALFLVLAFGFNSFACNNGCTPGFWKQVQSRDAWLNTDFYPTQDFDEVFQCGDDTGDLTLIAALKKGGGGIYALRRHAVANILNCASIHCFDGGSPQDTIDAYCAALGSAMSMEITKNDFEAENDQTCPFGNKNMTYP